MTVSDRHPTNLWAGLDPATVNELSEALAVPPALLKERRERSRRRAAIAVEVFIPGECHPRRRPLNDVSTQGLSFATADPIRPGTTISIRVPDCWPPLHVTARVAWSQLADASWEVGAYFVGGDAPVRERLMEEVCRLQRERDQAREEASRRLAARQAAEWIAHNPAALFADPTEN